MRLLLTFLFLISSSLANPLQDAIDNAPPYSTLKLSSGTYTGNIIINKPMSIIGENEDVIIDAQNNGSVIKIRSSHVILKNLTIVNSGSRMDKLDSGISMKKSKYCEISNVRILNSLYGIDMDMVEDSNISDNYITSKKLDISLKGDALKLYYSNHNIIKNNTIESSRDVTLNYSHNNLFINNLFKNNRFAIHIATSNTNTIKSNIYKYNAVSIMIMGAKDTKVMKNKILSSKGAAGIGVVINGVSNFKLEHNQLKFNAKAIYIDGQEKAKGMKRYINYNEIAYNGEAIHFHASITDNTITHNKVYGNIDDIVKDVEGNFRPSNIVQFNYWDRYTGFDRDADNIGDNSHQVYQYADQLWHYNNKVKFFYGSPIMSLLNFLANIAPFVEPNLILEDSKPVFNTNIF